VVKITKSLREITPPDNSRPVISSPNGLKISKILERITTGRRRVTRLKKEKIETTIKHTQSSLSNRQPPF